MQKHHRPSLLSNPIILFLAVILVAPLILSSWSTALAETPESLPGTLLLSSFYSFPQDAWMQVNWETALEVNVQGFNLYRRPNPDEDWMQVNDQLIQAANLGGFDNANYTWLDTGVEPGAFYEYMLEEVDSSGKTHQYGPSGTTPARLVFKQLFLPVVQH